MKHDDMAPARGGDADPTTYRTRRRYRLALDGLVAVHAVRAVWTALAGVPGVVSAEVTMQGALVETEGPLDERELRLVLAAVGIAVRAVHDESRRALPLAP